jgi:undecaprenyl diphosphate synthase
MSDNTAQQTIPKHVGIILDGHRRWAKAQGVPTLEGHRQGYQNLKDITRAAFERGVKYVSAYVFSTENWNRSEKEVKYLMDFAYRVATRDLKELHKDNIKVVWIGSPDKVNDKIIKAIKKAEETTKDNTQGTLALCFNYGGQQELADAVRKIVAQGLAPSEIDTDVLAASLYAPEIPPVDLLIRTSGEQRLSGFMTYRTSYSELYFTDKYWPDFSAEDLDRALEEFAGRNRRLGK